jgi:hypothetical protein
MLRATSLSALRGKPDASSAHRADRLTVQEAKSGEL